MIAGDTANLYAAAQMTPVVTRREMPAPTPILERTGSETTGYQSSDGDYVNKSAINDDDESADLEDVSKDSGKSSIDDAVFQRIDSKVDLSSRRSLLTLMIEENDRAHALGGPASQSTLAIPCSRQPQSASLAGSLNDSDEAPLMMKNARQSNLKPIHETPRSGTQPIPMQAALSPRTTRRNMLATELTDSLRWHLLWERQQKTKTANAVLVRRDTAQDVANLKQYPERAYTSESEDDKVNYRWNFTAIVSNGYHSRGW